MFNSWCTSFVAHSLKEKHLIMDQEDKQVKNIPVINRCLDSISKSMIKLQSLGVLTNFTYCLPPTGTIYTRGSWSSMTDMVAKNVNETGYKDFNAKVQEELSSILTRDSNHVALPLLGSLPEGKKASRDDLRPILTEMVRIAQSDGKFFYFFFFAFSNSYFESFLLEVQYSKWV